MSDASNIVPEGRPPKINSPDDLWNPAHLDVVRAGKASIDKWRIENPGEKLLLNGADLCKADLIGADLRSADLSNAYLDGAYLIGANLQRADLPFAHLNGTILSKAYLNGADLTGVHLKKASLDGAWLNEKEGEGEEAALSGTCLYAADLSGAVFVDAKLQGAKLQMAIVDGKTSLRDIEIDNETDCTGMGLGNVRMEPHIRSHLEYNIRRIAWEKQYKKSKLTWCFPGRMLWLANYGYSYGTRRIAWTFIFFAFAFASIYMIRTPAPACMPWLAFEGESFVEHLEVYNNDGEYVRWLTWVRAIYFSIVTMTTLGFGDIVANPLSLCGNILLILHVGIGYVLLGALITRFAILFQSVEG